MIKSTYVIYILPHTLIISLLGEQSLVVSCSHFEHYIYFKRFIYFRVELQGEKKGEAPPLADSLLK